MQTIYNIYEGIFDKKNAKDVGANVEAALNIPTAKDFVTNEYHKKMVGVLWDCELLLDQYRSKYPNLLKDWDSIQFQLDTEYRVVDVHTFFCKKSDMHGFGGSKKYIPGWNDGFVGANLRTYKKMVIDIISSLAHNPSKLEEFLKHADYARKEVESGNVQHEIKELYDLR